MDNKKQLKEWESFIVKASKALHENNFILYESLMSSANKEYEQYKRNVELTYECKNFGMANYIFEDALPKLFKNNQKAVGEFINTIKEDKNLLSQFQFYKALEKNNESVNTKEYITESLDLVKKNINPRTMNESLGKINKIIKKYDIKPSEFISDEDLKLFEDCNFLFKSKKNVNNLLEVNSKLDSVVDYTKKHYNRINEDKENYFKLIENFDKKYKNLLTEEEQDFVKEIMSFQKGDKDRRKEKLFYNFKNECLNTIDKLLSEASDEEKDDLLSIKEQISCKVFCEDTLVKDMAKLLEIRDILLDE